MSHVVRGDVWHGHGSDVYGMWCAQGTRPHMEDAHVVLESLGEHIAGEAARAMSLYAVYDGHAGSGAAEFAAETLHACALAHADFLTDPCRALAIACNTCDRLYLERHDADPDDKRFSCGTTALVVLLSPGHVVVSNLGDCRAVLCRGGSALQLSKEHSPSDERARIEAAGGWVTEERELCFKKLHHTDLKDADIRAKAQKNFSWIQTSRINGELAVSRAIGDANYKGERKHRYDWFWPDEDNPGTFTADLVLAEPDVAQHARSADDAFLILACDGLWEVMSNQDAVDRVLSHVADGSTPVECSRRLVEYALRLGSSDNVTAMVIMLGATPADASGAAGAGARA